MKIQCPNEEFEFTIYRIMHKIPMKTMTPVPYFDLDENDEPVLTGSLSFAEGC